MTATDWTSGTSATGRYADLNGLHLYYEVHGTGRPLVLLHGGLGSGDVRAGHPGGSSRPATRSSHPTCRATAGRRTSTGRSTFG